MVKFDSLINILKLIVCFDYFFYVIGGDFYLLGLFFFLFCFFLKFLIVYKDNIDIVCN